MVEQAALHEINHKATTGHGDSLLDQAVGKVDPFKLEQANEYISEHLTDYLHRVGQLLGVSDAKETLAWIADQAKDEDNVLFRVLAHHHGLYDA